MAQVEYLGHANSGGLQKHSIGAEYPYTIVGTQQNVWAPTKWYVMDTRTSKCGVLRHTYKEAQEDLSAIRRINVQNIAIKDAEIARWKTVPMKYRRMEFNAQLQAENAALKTDNERFASRLAELHMDKDALKEQLSKGKSGRELELEQYVEKCTESIAALKEQVAQLEAELEDYRMQSGLMGDT